MDMAELQALGPAAGGLSYEAAQNAQRMSQLQQAEAVQQIQMAPWKQQELIAKARHENAQAIKLEQDAQTQALMEKMAAELFNPGSAAMKDIQDSRSPEESRMKIMNYEMMMELAAGRPDKSATIGKDLFYAASATARADELRASTKRQQYEAVQMKMKARAQLAGSIRDGGITANEAEAEFQKNYGESLLEGKEPTEANLVSLQNRALTVDQQIDNKRKDLELEERKSRDAVRNTLDKARTTILTTRNNLLQQSKDAAEKAGRGPTDSRYKAIESRATSLIKDTFPDIDPRFIPGAAQDLTAAVAARMQQHPALDSGVELQKALEEARARGDFPEIFTQKTLLPYGLGPEIGKPEHAGVQYKPGQGISPERPLPPPKSEATLEVGKWYNTPRGVIKILGRDKNGKIIHTEPYARPMAGPPGSANAPPVRELRYTDDEEP